MRFDQLPTELILKISKSCHPITNHNLKFTNSRNYNVVEKWSNSQLYRMNVNLVCTTFENEKSAAVELKIGETIDNILAIEYFTVVSQHGWHQFNWHFIRKIPLLLVAPELRKIRTFEVEGDYICLAPGIFSKLLEFYKVENLVLKQCKKQPEVMFINETYINNQVFRAVTGNIEIEFVQTIESMMSFNTATHLTSCFLGDLLMTPRKCFKLKNLQTNFDLDAIVILIEDVANRNIEVDWEFGYNSTMQYPSRGPGRFQNSIFVKSIKNMLAEQKIIMEKDECLRYQIHRYTFKTFGKQSTIVFSLDRDARFLHQY